MRSSATTQGGMTAATSASAVAGYEQRTKDIGDAEPADLEGFDAVVHLAAISNDPIGQLNPDATYSVNADGAVHLARVAKQAGVPRFLFSSSCSLYGAAGDAPGRPRPRLQPGDPYGESKVLAEAGHLRARRRHVQPDIPPQRHRVRLVAAAARRHRRQQPHRRRHHPRRGSAAERRQPMAAAGPRRGHRRAFLAAMEADRSVVHNEAFNVGRDADVVQIRDIADEVARGDRRAVTFAEDAGPDKRDYRVDFTKITEDCRRSGRSGPCPSASTRSFSDMTRLGLTAEDFESPDTSGSHKSHGSWSDGRMDDNLRVRRRGGRAMKVVLFCGGLGMRMRVGDDPRPSR